jgi:hypothetical protein
MNKDLKSYTVKALKELIESIGGRGFDAGYIFSFILNKFIKTSLSPNQFMQVESRLLSDKTLTDKKKHTK